MANITFSSPALKKDVTLYAVAGKTLLSIAQELKVPIHHECQNGECGSCIVKVSHLGSKPPKATHLTEKEKTVLLLNGKLSKGDIAQLELADVAPAWRLACQYLVLDEDILVEF